MARRRGFFLLDLTLAIVLIVALASVFSHLVWLYNRDCGRLAAIRNAARNEQTMLYHATGRPRGAVGRQWVIMPAKAPIRASRALPVGSHWIAIHSADNSAGRTLYALTLSLRTKRAEGTK